MSELRHADLLVELGCEELPPKSLATLAGAFFEGVCEQLDAAGLAFSRDKSTFYFTPRRMTLLLRDTADRQPDQVQERRGPATSAAFDTQGKPTPAATGFARSVGREVAELERLATDKGEWLYCKLGVPGKPLQELLFPVLQAALDRLPVPRPMRWGSHDFSFVRPVHWLVVLHGKDIIEGSLYGCAAGRLTRGHRILNPGPFSIPGPDAYLDVLRAGKVEADQAARRRRISEGAQAAGADTGGQTRITDSLLDEVNNLVEWPVAVLCHFDQRFLAVPQEALVASMEDHQKFFPVLNAGDGRLTPAFVVISNLESTDTDALRSGFERVIRPRLADAEFFWQQDLKTPLADLIPKLNDIVFQKKLGSVGDKSKRVADISRQVAAALGLDADQAERAARLCKCDLLTHMVSEFPELQGTMGGHYATASGEDVSIATAIASHYAPRFSGDAVPDTALGQVLSLADRLDTLCGIFAAGLVPTGNKDPYALRRAALGVLRILLEARLPLTIDQLLDVAAEAMAQQIEVGADTLEALRHFVLERLRHLLIEQGYSANQVRAALDAPLDTLPDLADRVEAVAAFMRQPAAAPLVAANKRISNILKKADDFKFDAVDRKLLQLDEEKRLYDEISRISKELKPLIKRGAYTESLALLSALGEPVDAFFDGVMVMDDDAAVRLNRLRLLAQLKQQFDRIADFSLAD